MNRHIERELRVSLIEAGILTGSPFGFNPVIRFVAPCAKNHLNTFLIYP